MYITKPIYLNGELTKYLVDTDGQIINKKSGKKLKLQLDKDGYYIVKITHNGKSITKRVNQLVAKGFIPNPDNKPETHHKDRDRTNNKPENLEWCDRVEHFEIERKAFGKFVRARGEKQGSSKYTDNLIRKAAIDMSNGVPVLDVSSKYKISTTTLYNVYNKKSYTHLTEDLIFAERNNPKRDEYSNELKSEILRLLQQNKTPKQIILELNLDNSPKIKNYIKTMKNRKIKKKGSTTIKNDDIYYTIEIH